jgi:1-acyl-sn-glycerol-3-phosphate acyltransferase
MNRILRGTLGPWLVRNFNLTGENHRIFDGMARPFLVLPNHTSVWDPFMVNAFVPGPIHYVVSDANFRSRLMEFGLGLVGSIPKTKVMSDLDTVKTIMQVKNGGGIVGIFPEGQNTWDGHSLPIYHSTAKLAKLLRVPVITARIAGAFLSKPRWARCRRKGAVNIRFDLAYTPDELRAIDAEEIDRKIATLLNHDEFDYNRSRGVLYRGEALAEYVERALFACPACHELSTLRSDDDLLFCTACGHTVRYGESGLFSQHTGSLHFDNLHDWNVWQTEHLRTRLSSYVPGKPDSPIFREEEVKVSVGYKSMPLEDYMTGAVELYADRIALVAETGETESLPINEIRGMNVQNNERLEFYSGEDLFRFTPSDPRACTYKWDLAVHQIKSILRPENGNQE